MRGKYAVWILEKKRPGLLTLHLTALDHIEHETGAFSAESIATIERLDGIIGKVREAAERVAPGHAIVAVVSDHGFANYDQQLNLFAAFRAAKLFTVDENGKITNWRAMPWVTGGSAAIVLKDAQDKATLGEVRELLAKLAADPANGIDRVLESEELHKRGGYPNASFFVSLKPGWRTGAALTGPVVAKVKPGGTHGQLPDVPELRAAFFVVGPGIPAGRDLGLMDMRDVAPTLAKEAGLPELPLASLAKEEELLFRPGRPQPIRLPDGSRGKHLLQQVRDETHRFALAYHRTLRGKAGLRSALDGVPGIGPRRKRQLLQRFGSLARLRVASVEELTRMGGLPPQVAKATHRMLNANSGS